ncbi:MAG: hypothetical protein AAGA65_27540 [Actinomycetota bacterium]
MDTHITYLVRIWLPDRPGALGAVASRFGALRGDVTGLEIVERGGGQAIDELVVSLPADVPIDLIVREISSVEEVEVEDIRRLDGSSYDPQLDVLEAAAIVLGAENRDELADALSEHVCRAIHASWACVMLADGPIVGAWGDCPNERWLHGFVTGSPSAAGSETDVRSTADGGGQLAMDTIWIPLPAAGASRVVGRDGVFRARERQRLAALARIADAWFRRMKERSDWEALFFHPSRG